MGVAGTSWAKPHALNRYGAVVPPLNMRRVMLKFCRSEMVQAMSSRSLTLALGMCRRMSFSVWVRPATTYCAYFLMSLVSTVMLPSDWTVVSK